MTGKLVDAEGKPLGFTRLSVADASAAARRWNAYIAGDIVTAADGSFRVAGLAAGKFFAVTAWPTAQPAPPKVQFELAAGEHKTGLTIATPRGATLRGRLDGPRPDVPWHLLVLPEWQFGDPGAASTNDTPRRIEIDAADSRFAISGLAPGTYRTDSRHARAPALARPGVRGAR